MNSNWIHVDRLYSSKSFNCNSKLESADVTTLVIAWWHTQSKNHLPWLCIWILSVWLNKLLKNPHIQSFLVFKHMNIHLFTIPKPLLVFNNNCEIVMHYIGRRTRHTVLIIFIMNDWPYDYNKEWVANII